MSETTETKETKGDDQIKDLTKAVESLVNKHGDPNGALRALMSENYNYRDQIRDLKAKLPADGAVVLSGDDAKSWREYQLMRR